MSRTAPRRAKGAAPPLSWVAAVVAVPVALVAWVAATIALTLRVTTFVPGGLIALGVVAAVGCLLLLGGPRARGAGVGAIATLVPCALMLGLSLL